MSLLYPKIETLFERDEKTHKVKPGVFKNPAYDLIKRWHFTEKIDGTNIRCVWDHTVRSVTFGGRTDNASLPADLVKWLYVNVTHDKMLAKFPEVDVTLFGEGYGPGIQPGGGDYGPEKKLILFDVVVESKWWLDYPNVKDVATALGLEAVPQIETELPLEDAVQLVRAGFPSRLNGGKKQAEGLVGKTSTPLFDKYGNRLVIKLKTKDF